MPARTLNRKARKLTKGIVAAIHAIEPDARIVLYGSRARGDAAPDSDWDLLVLLDGPVDDCRAGAVRHRVYALERVLDDAPVLSTLVLGEQQWNSTPFPGTPFRAEVERHGLEP